MKWRARAAILATFIGSILLLSTLLGGEQEEEDGPPCQAYSSANQTLHKQLLQRPLAELLLQTPRPSKRPHLLILVITPVFNRAERDEIRMLWASPLESRALLNGMARVIFVLGADSEFTKAVEEENNEYGDIIQTDVPEHYRNLVYKQDVAFRWAVASSNASLVLKADADTVVHVDRLLREMEPVETLNQQDWIGCFYSFHGQPIRDECSPWYVSREDYPHDWYPLYCGGPGYIMRRDVMEKILQGASTMKVIEVEDVYFTGISAFPLSISLICLDHIFAGRYISHSECSSTGNPHLSVLPTHYQISNQSRHSLPLAWETLKAPYCFNTLTRWWIGRNTLLRCSMTKPII